MAQKVDAKELLKNNLPLWITYGVALVPVILYFVVVGGVQGEIEIAEGQLVTKSKQLEGMAKKIDAKNPDEPLYTEKDVSNFQERKKVYQTAVGKLGQVVQSRDAPLEKWFTSEKWKGTDPEKVTPDANDYQVEYTKQVGFLRDSFKAILPDPTLVFAGEGLSQDKMLKFQKRFWIQQACLEALKSGGARKLTARIEFPENTGVTEDPNRPYTPIPVQFTFEIDFPNLPKVIHALLTQEIAFRVTRLAVEKTPFEIKRTEPVSFVITAPDGVFEKECEGVKFRDKAPENVGTDYWIPEPPIKVDVTLEALDFRPQPKPAPAEGEGAGEGAGEAGTEKGN